MDIINYALSKKIKKYVDDISSSNQVQSDWMQNDETASDYVKGRTHYSKLQLVEVAFYQSGDAYKRFYNVPSLLENTEDLFSIEINGILYTDLRGYECKGDADPSVWENGGGMGFYMVRYYDVIKIYIDTNRYGNIRDAIIKLYKQNVEKVLPHNYLPISTYDTLGCVSVEQKDDLSGYTDCAIDSYGRLYSKEYNAAKIFSELSIINLDALTNNLGDHGLYTDSFAEEFIDCGLTLPVHAWFIGLDYSSAPYQRKYILESADGTIMKLSLVNSEIKSVSVISKPSSGGTLIVTQSDGDSNYATHSPAEIYEAFQSGKTVLFEADGTLLQLVLFSDFMVAFSLIASMGGTTVNITITIDENSLIDYSNQLVQLNPVPPQDSMILNSSTDGSAKQFQITVDDSGTITATEVQ